MSWTTIENAVAELGISRATIERRVAADAIPSTVRDGRRLVWIGATPDAAALLVAELGERLAHLERILAVAPSTVRVPALAPSTVRGPTLNREGETRPTPTRPAATHDISRAALLELIGEVWTGSESELERRAGVSKAWIYKARRRERAGKPESIKGRASRLALLAVLEAERQKANTSAQPAAADSIAA